VKRIVLDASAVMAFFLGRSGGEKVKQMLVAAAEGKRELLMSVVNWGEVYYSIWRDRGREDAEKALGYISQLPIKIIPADAAQAKRAAEFKAQYKLPYADGFAAALAAGQGASVAVCDRDFGRIEREVAIEWVGGP
jgi:predicted nucleic acid-binding protein